MAAPQIPAEAMAKVKAGHDLEHDPPAAITLFRRWTCTRCGGAVLHNGVVTYGGATERTCEESQRFWGVGVR